jgi:hypothetical protein
MKNKWKMNVELKFYVTIGTSTLVSQNPGRITVGDTIVLVNDKYNDSSMREFIGRTYTTITVVDTVSPNVYETVTIRRLKFEEIGQVVTDGVATLKLLAGPDNNLSLLEIVASDIAVVGGTGQFVGCTGRYLTESVNTNKYLGRLQLHIKQ